MDIWYYPYRVTRFQPHCDPVAIFIGSSNATSDADGYLRPDSLRPVGSDGQRLAINTSHGERLPAGHKAPRDVHDAERSRNSHGHYAGRAEHGALDGQPERNDVSARDAGAGRDRDRDTAGRDDPMKEKP